MNLPEHYGDQLSAALVSPSFSNFKPIVFI